MQPGLQPGADECPMCIVMLELVRLQGRRGRALRDAVLLCRPSTATSPPPPARVYTELNGTDADLGAFRDADAEAPLPVTRVVRPARWSACGVGHRLVLRARECRGGLPPRRSGDHDVHPRGTEGASSSGPAPWTVLFRFPGRFAGVLESTPPVPRQQKQGRRDAARTRRRYSRRPLSRWPDIEARDAV